MANAQLTYPGGIQTGNFIVVVSFTENIDGFEKTDVNMTALLGNGVMGVDFTLTGEDGDDTFNLNVTLPEDVSGSMSFQITGMVTPSGGSTPEAVMANTLVVVYDNITQVTASWGTVAYRSGGRIVVPVTFGENVIAPSRTIFKAARLTGDYLADVDYELVGEDAAYELIFEIPEDSEDREGLFRVTANGDVLKASTNIWDNVIIDPLVIGYQRRVPRIEDMTLPVEIATNLFQSVISFDKIVSHLWTSDFGYGVELDGSAVLYRSVDFETLPDLPVLVNADDLTEPNCVESWEYVSAVGPPWGVGRFFVLRFKRKSTDIRTPELVLNQDSFQGYIEA